MTGLVSLVGRGWRVGGGGEGKGWEGGYRF